MILYAAFSLLSDSPRISLISLLARMLMFISSHAGCYNQAHNFQLTIKGEEQIWQTIEIVIKE